MFGYDAAQTGSSPDTAINSANVSTVQPLFSVPSQTDGVLTGSFGSPVESGGVVFVGSNNPDSTSGSLEAFDANGATDCSGSPNQCSPLWTGSTGLIGSNTPAVANGVVYITSSATSVSATSEIPSTLYAFDANGVTDCSGSPKVCQPLWTAPLSSADANDSSPVVTNGMVYVSGDQPPAPGGSPTGAVEAFDANGVTDCSGSPKVCQPLWTSAADAAYSPLAVANGVLYTTATTGTQSLSTSFEATLDAFSANGATNCSGTPTACSPLWTAPVGSVGAIATTSPVVSGSVVYQDNTDAGNLSAFDANGVTNCSGTPTTCTPLWTAANVIGPLAVASGVLYVETFTNNSLSAFDANGVTDCSGSPKVCQPLWSYSLMVPV